MSELKVAFPAFNALVSILSLIILAIIVIPIVYKSIIAILFVVNLAVWSTLTYYNLTKDE